MCDYSLHSHPNRLAEAGETLVATRFSFGSIGFASAADLASRAALEFQSAPLTAVCVPPGAQLMLHDIPCHLQQELGVSETEEVTFTQLGCDAWAYRDAVRFSNGKQILLQRLNEKQRAMVVHLGDREAVTEQTEDRVPAGVI